MADDHERRISTVEANYNTLAASMLRMEASLGRIFRQQGDIQTSVALVVQNQSGMKDYQIKCDHERADHEKRITETEGFQGRLIKCAVAITGIGSLASPQLTKLWEKMFL